MPVGQSPFLLQGVPVTPLGGCSQLPAWQTSDPSQTFPPQQGWEAPPQAMNPLVDEVPEEAPDDAPEDTPAVEPPVAPDVLFAPLPPELEAP